MPIKATPSHGDIDETVFLNQARDILKQKPQVKLQLQNAGDKLKIILDGKSKDDFFEGIRKTIGNLLSLGNSPEYTDWRNRFTPNDEATAEQVRQYLKKYYFNFDDYDQVSFPVYYQTPVGEAVEVDVIRISPFDATSLIDEEKEIAEKKDKARRKLAGDKLYAFSGFLDKVWRDNDILWGRLDAAERIITALLPDDDKNTYIGVRQILIQEAQEIILQDELIECNSLVIEDFCRAVISFQKTKKYNNYKTLKDFFDFKKNSTQRELEKLFFECLVEGEFIENLQKLVSTATASVPVAIQESLRKCLKTEIGCKILHEHYQYQTPTPHPLALAFPAARTVTEGIINIMNKIPVLGQYAIKLAALGFTPLILNMLTKTGKSRENK